MTSLPQHDCFDIIGDIHGFAVDLEALLGRLGYHEEAGIYRHRQHDRRAIFVGDFIDRGPNIKRVLKIVRAMVEAGTAYAVMGNHEFNAIAYATKHEGGYLRSHNQSHINQHQETLNQIGDGQQISATWREWLRTLPPYLDNGALRVVHACWDPWAIKIMDDALARHGEMNDDFMIEALPAKKRGDLFMAVEWLFKGKEVRLPVGMEPFRDNDGKQRNKMRVRWFDLPQAPTFSGLIFPPGSAVNLLSEPVPTRLLTALSLPATAYPDHAPPVFFGHYWLGEPVASQTPNVVCLDYSVAKGGKLVACTWHRGEPITTASFTISR